MTSRVKHALGIVLATTAVATGTVLASASAAQAKPTNCSQRYELNEYWVYCGQGNGSFRAVVHCYKPGSSSYTTRYGAWKAAGDTISIASCAASEDPAEGKWELKDGAPA